MQNSCSRAWPKHSIHVINHSAVNIPKISVIMTSSKGLNLIQAAIQENVNSPQEQLIAVLVYNRL